MEGDGSEELLDFLGWFLSWITLVDSYVCDGQRQLFSVVGGKVVKVGRATGGFQGWGR